MAKTNYTFEKRQKELAKKKKQEEKRLRKIAPQTEPSLTEPPQAEIVPPPVDEKTDS